jgi:transcriptional regulator with XRE-family HTH domain
MPADAQAAELGAFLMARRQEIDPADLGLPQTGRRRVKGLRREEVAQQAAISTDYYARIEQGRRPVSENVLDAIAEVLRLTAQQRAYVFNLARSAAVKTDPRTRRGVNRPSVSATVQALIDAMTAAPAVVQNQRFDILATNALGRALLAPVLEGSPRPNMARFAFLDASAPDFLLDWDQIADGTVAALRLQASASSHRRELTDLVGELAVGSDAFRTRWAAHKVRSYPRASKRFNHPIVGALELSFEALELPDTGLTIFAYVAEAGSRSEEQLRLLADWTAPQHPGAVRSASTPAEHKGA